MGFPNVRPAISEFEQQLASIRAELSMITGNTRPANRTDLFAAIERLQLPREINIDEIARHLGIMHTAPVVTIPSQAIMHGLPHTHLSLKSSFDPDMPSTPPEDRET